MNKKQIILELAHKIVNSKDDEFLNFLADDIIFIVADRLGDKEFAQWITPRPQSGARTDAFYEKWANEKHQENINETLKTIKSINP